MVLIYDADCGFCRRALAWGRRRLAMPEAVGFQEADTNALGVSREEASRSIWLVDGPRRWHGAAAAARILRAQPLTPLPGAPWLRLHGLDWRALGWAMAVPPISWAAEGAYRLVARNRSRLPGASDACSVQTGRDASRVDAGRDAR